MKSVSRFAFRVSRSRFPVSGFLSAAVFVVAFGLGAALAQEHKPAQPQMPPAQTQAAPAQAQTAPAQTQAAPAQTPEHGAKGRESAEKAAQASTPGAQLAEASREAAGEEEENAQFKKSASVQWLAKHVGLSTSGGYWLAFALNFAVLALLIVWALKKNLPAMFRTRTESIQRAMVEARKASDEANQRLADIESRLASMDVEIGAMRATAEQEAAAEEARIMAAAEEDKRRIVEAAEAEIAAAAKLARRELKSYAADLAVGLAEKRIHVDAATDQALVRSFTDQLGTADGAGKDGK